MSDERKVVLDIQGLGIDFGGLTAVNDLNLQVHEGDIYGLIGPNGAGKTTVFNMLTKVYQPTRGKIFFNGEDFTEASITDRANAGIAFAFQQPVRFKGINVLDLIRIATGKKLSAGQACEYLSLVGLCAKDYIDREVNDSLSGGELKRIEIATVIARGSKLSVFDEPEAGIDLWSFQNLIKVFQKLREEIRDSSILIISHQERILNIADEIVVLKNGTIEKQGSREEVFPGLIGTPAAVGNCAKLTEEEGRI